MSRLALLTALLLFLVTPSLFAAADREASRTAVMIPVAGTVNGANGTRFQTAKLHDPAPGSAGRPTHKRPDSSSDGDASQRGKAIRWTLFSRRATHQARFPSPRSFRSLTPAHPPFRMTGMVGSGWMGIWIS
jgi:hypothetical protein